MWSLTEQEHIVSSAENGNEERRMGLTSPLRNANWKYESKFSKCWDGTSQRWRKAGRSDPESAGDRHGMGLQHTFIKASSSMAAHDSGHIDKHNMIGTSDCLVHSREDSGA